MSKILIATEKYGTRYFDASTEELKNAAAFKILKERFKDGYYYDWLNEDVEPRENALSNEQIQNLPEPYKSKAMADEKEYLRAVEESESNKNTFASIKDCVENNKTNRAYRLLLEFSNGEYEGIQLEKLEQI